MKTHKDAFLNTKNLKVVIISVLLMLTVVATFTFDVFCDAYAAENKSGKTKKTEKSEIKEPVVSSDSFIVMSGSTSEVVYELNANRKLPMGNITKLMTAMVVIDNMYDSSEYDNTVEVRKKADSYGDLFKEGERVSVEDMLYAMLVGGSDEAAEALAVYSASSRDTFISEMNTKALELKLMETQYHNPTGRYNVDHYSTAEESAIVVQAAMRYAKIAEIIKADTHAVKIEGKKRNRSFTVTNTNPLISSTDSTEKYAKATGGIAGESDQPVTASQYAGVAVDDGMQLIVILLNENANNLAKDAKSLFEYGYKTVTKNVIVKADEKMGKVRVKGGARTRVSAYTETRGYAYVPPEGSTDLVQTQVVMDDDVQAPLKAGDKVGEYKIYVADELKGTVNLVVKKDVKEGWFLSKIYIGNFAAFFVMLFGALLLALLLRILYVRWRREKRREQRRQALIREEARKQMEIEEDRRRRNWTY